MTDNLPTVPGTILLLDAHTGIANALMNATLLTAMRTAAGSALATSVFGNFHDGVSTASVRNTYNMVIFGAGMQAEAHIQCIMCVKPEIRSVIIINRSVCNAEHLIGKMNKNYRGDVQFKAIGLEDTAEVRSAVENADIIVTATNSSTPLFDGKWLKPGAHLNCVGSYTKSSREIDSLTVSRCRVIMIDTHDALSTSGDLAFPSLDGTLEEDDTRVCTLGSILNKQSNIDRFAFNQDETRTCTLFKSVGTAVQDISTAAVVFNEAQKRCIGTDVKL